MIRSALARRLVTGISIVMLLLCQSAAAAFACGTGLLAPPVTYAQTMDAAAPCHQDALDTQGSTPDHDGQERCLSRYASSERAKINIPAAESLALTIFTVAPPGTAITVAAPHEHILASATPPPLLLLYCRLLI